MKERKKEGIKTLHTQNHEKKKRCQLASLMFLSPLEKQQKPDRVIRFVPVFLTPFQCVFFIQNEKIFRFFHFEEFFLGRLEKKINILEDFLREIIKNKGKIVLEARNTENFRLRRAKMEDFIVILVQNRQIWLKLRPKGAKIFGGRKYFSFLKSKKKTLLQMNFENKTHRKKTFFLAEKSF